MEIKNFFHKIFTGNREPEVPKAVRQKFNEQFNQSINIEWQKTGELYEAIFYRDEREHIASYQKDGLMTCLKINLPLNVLPQKVERNAQKHGELMNAIQIECNDEIQFELIIRDEMLVRFSLLLNDEGELLNKRQL